MTTTLITRLEERMEKSITKFREDMFSLRTGSANPALLNRVFVSYYGTETPLLQLAQITAQDARTLVIAPYDKSALEAIETAILQANLGLNPTNDGQMIRIFIPPLTVERRQELVKQLKLFAEDAKVAIRNIRRDGNDMLKKANYTEDELKKEQKRIQELTDTCIRKINDIQAQKEADILTI